MTIDIKQLEGLLERVTPGEIVTKLHSATGDFRYYVPNTPTENQRGGGLK